jgi:hypothetical protein
MTRFEKQFEQAARQRLRILDRITSAKIASGAFGHVRHYLHSNLLPGGQKGPAPMDSQFYDLLSQLLNSHRLQLLALSTEEPETQRRILKYACRVEVSGRMKNFMGFISRLERSGRIVVVSEISVSPVGESEAAPPSPLGRIHAKILLHTYLVRKEE